MGQLVYNTEIFGFDNVVFAQDHCPFYQISQFAYVSGKTIALKQVKDFGRYLYVGFGHFFRKLFHKVFHQQGYVFFAFAQGREMNDKRADTVKKIGSEEFGIGYFFETFVGCCNNADIKSLFLLGSHLDVFLLFEHPQKLHLQVMRHIADFIEKQAAFVGGFEPAGFVGNGARKTSLFMSEKFTFEQTFGNGRHIDRSEQFVPSSTQVVNTSGHQLFTCAAFSDYQHRSVGRAGYQAHLVLDFFNGGRFPYHLYAHLFVDPLPEAAAFVFFQLKILFQFGKTLRFFDRHPDIRRCKRFFEIIDRPTAQGFDNRIHIAGIAHHDYLDMRIIGFYSF